MGWDQVFQNMMPERVEVNFTVLCVLEAVRCDDFMLREMSQLAQTTDASRNRLQTRVPESCPGGKLVTF